MASVSGLGEEGGEAIVALGLILGWHASIGLDTVLQAVQLPTGVSDLDASLANVNGDHFSHRFDDLLQGSHINKQSYARTPYKIHIMNNQIRAHRMQISEAVFRASEHRTPLHCAWGSWGIGLYH